MAQSSLGLQPSARCAIEMRKDDMMQEVFPEPIKNLPKADIPLDGITAYLSQSDTHRFTIKKRELSAEIHACFSNPLNS